MTQKNYSEFAATIRAMKRPEMEKVAWILDIAEFFKKDNIHFNTQKFYKECGVDIPSMSMERRLKYQFHNEKEVKDVKPR